MVKKDTAETKSEAVKAPKKTAKKNEKVKTEAEPTVTAAETPVVVAEEKKAAAKAGKRSEKALKEAEEKLAKEERKQEAVVENKPPRVAITQKPPRTRLERRGKAFLKAAEQIDQDKTYTLNQAIELATKTSPVKFDASVELHVRLGVDPRQADQNLRDTVVLPSGTGKIVRVAVFADADQVAVAKKAGADIAAGDEFLQQLDKGTIDFDILIATPATMAKLGKYARLLGPKGLMPNPKSGTVTTDITKAVTEAKAGRVEYRVDSTGIVHVTIGKVSFGTDKLLSNTQAIISSLKANKPGSLKGTYFRSLYVTTSMGPSIKITGITEA